VILTSQAEREIRIAMLERGLRQWQFATTVGASPSTFCEILKRRRPISEPMLTRLAQVLGRDPGELVTGE
jgi:plasmid maintenance system antidote protein VapI